ALSQAVSAGPYTSGSPVTFTTTITNTGAITWSGLTLTDTLPAGLTYDSSKISTSGGSCTASTTTPVKLTCAVGTLAAPKAATVAITLTPTQSGKLTNTVALTPSGYSYNRSTGKQITVS